MSDASPVSGTAIKRVELGRFVLVIGDRAGTAIADDGTQGDARALAKAIERTDKEPTAQPEARRGPDEAIEDAATVADRLEHALHLFTDFAEGRRDLTAIGEEASFLLDLLQRLDRDERWAEAIHVARVLAKLLALLARWKDLLSSLRLAWSLAERIGDDDGKAWALQELGILHLAAGKREAADSLLTHAHEVRRHISDGHALRLLERDLQVLCRTLRADLHASRWRRLEQIPDTRAIAAAIAASLLVLGGVAGAVGNRSGKGPAPTTTSVVIASTPELPRPGDQVAFKVRTSTKADPYFWWFGDGRSSSAADPKHVYRQPGLYRAIVVVTDSKGTILASASSLVEVRRHPRAKSAKPPTRKRAGGKTTSGATSAKSTIQGPSAKPATSTITSSCPSGPVILGTAATIEGAVEPAPARETPIAVVYTMPSGALQSKTSTTDIEGSYMSVVKASQLGEWSVSSSWPGDSGHRASTSEGCSFEVRTREELSTESSESPSSFTENHPPRHTRPLSYRRGEGDLHAQRETVMAA